MRHSRRYVPAARGAQPSIPTQMRIFEIVAFQQQYQRTFFDIDQVGKRTERAPFGHSSTAARLALNQNLNSPFSMQHKRPPRSRWPSRRRSARSWAATAGDCVPRQLPPQRGLNSRRLPISGPPFWQLSWRASIPTAPLRLPASPGSSTRRNCRHHGEQSGGRQLPWRG